MAMDLRDPNVWISHLLENLPEEKLASALKDDNPNWEYIDGEMNRPGFPGECFICELRLPDHRFRWKHNKLFLLLPVGYGPAFPAIVDCYTSPPT
ncbi:BfpM-like protein [Escherichia coli]|nr:BfpM-like protein [Escherichia coli]